MFELRFTAKFKKDYKWVKRQSKGLSKLEWTLEMLMREEALPDATRDHSLDATCHGLASATSSLTGCSSTASTRTGSSSSLHVRGTKRATRAVRHSNLHSEEEGHNVSINSS